MTTQIHDAALLNQLWEAAAAGDNATVRILAMNGVDLDARNDDDCTAFNLATRYNHPDTAKTILAAREFQYLQKVGIELSRIGNLHNPSSWKHHSA